MRTNSLILTVIMLAAAGCSPDRLYQPSGFLPDYSRLQPQAELGDALAWVNRSKPLSVYTMVTLDPITIKTEPIDGEPAQLSPEQQGKLSQIFEEALRAALSPAYPIVDHPGFGVLRLRLAVTNVRLAGSGPLFSGGPKRMIMEGVDLSKGVFEAEMIDTQSGDRIMLLLEENPGRNYRLPVSAYPNRSAGDIFNSWALLIRDSLDVERGLHTSGDFRLRFGK